MRIDKDVGTEAARQASESRELGRVASKIVAKARANAAAHRETGKYSGNFKAKPEPGPHGVVDVVVYNDHPAAMSVEFGHVAKSKEIGPNRFVPGQFNLMRAMWDL